MKSLTRFIDSRILKKWGSLRLRSAIWNREFASGQWNYIDRTTSDPIYLFIEKHSNGGAILDVGCGTGNTGIEIAADKYTRYRGVDISQTAIDKAVSRSHASGRADTNSYVCGDMLAYSPTEKYDLIVFRECLWYVRRAQSLGMLRRYAGSLKEDGKMLASVCPGAQQRWLSVLIERHFRVVDKFHEQERGLIVVFR